MKPDRIVDILDLAKEARRLGLVFNPMFVGEAGLGKSQIIQQWVKKEQEEDPDFGFIDCRIAYYEGPDFVGYPSEKEIEGVLRMIHALPEMWPTKGRGLLLFEEPNRGNSMVMNCLMQILTDRAIGSKYKLPDGWIIAGAMNPEGSKYDVNNMDIALMDRFEVFRVDYDFNTFIHYAEMAKWHPKVLTFLKSGAWVYKSSDAVSKDGKYISPRTWSKLNAAEMSGASSHPSKNQTHYVICQAILGKHIGAEYWKSCWDDAPVLANDILADREKALKKLESQASAENYQGDKIGITVDSITENYGGYYEGRKQLDGKGDWPHQEGTIDEELMVAVMMIIPSDQAVNLLRDCAYKVSRGDVAGFLRGFHKRHPECIKIMRGNIQVERVTTKK